MASKYSTLADYLRRQSERHHAMNYTEIEGLIGTRLPASARERSSSRWDNDHSPDSCHYQSKRGLLAAGWEVESFDPIRQTVTFRK
jgi:hypothetical protein